MTPAEIQARYRRDGLVIVKRAFSPAEIEELRARVASIPEAQRKGDVLSCAPLRSVLFDPRVIDPVKAILGPRVLYFGDSTIRWETTDGTRSFHRDSELDEVDPATTEYPVIRVGLYLQDHARHGGGLKVRVGSYKHVFLGRRNFKRLFVGDKDGRLSFSSFRLGRAVNLPIEAGDLLLWNMRTWHSGYAVRLKHFPGLCLNPRLERFVPKSWMSPEIKPRGALFMAFAAPSAASETYIRTRVERPENVEHWKHCSFDEPALEKQCAEAGLELRRDGLQWDGRRTL